MLPVAMSVPCSANFAARTFGPGRSTRMPTLTPSSSATARMRRNRSIPSSKVPCASPIRATFIPARTISRRVVSSSEAGPMVATIFVRRSIPERY